MNTTSNAFHIVIDAVCLGRRKTGNETYIRGLLEGLARAPSAWTLDNRPVRFTILTTVAHTGLRQPCYEWIDIPLANFVTRNFFTIPKLLTQLHADLFHGVYWMRWWNPPCPTLVTVHDLSFVSFPQGFKRHERLVYASVIRWCAHKARHLATISHFSKSELVTRWKLPHAKVTVTYLGVDSRFCVENAGDGKVERGEGKVERGDRREERGEGKGERGGVGEISPQSKIENQKSSITSHSPDSPLPYLLAVGNLHPRKNLQRLIEAFVKLKRERGIEHQLRIVGQTAWLFDDVFDSVRRHNLEGEVLFTGYLSDEEIVQVYRGASVMVYPSLYEGFGFPPLEAMACGCPVVCSTAASLPEVCGDVAVMVNPESVDSIAEGIFRVLSDEALRGNLSARGPAQAAKFTWKQCAEETLNAYGKAVGERGEWRVESGEWRVERGEGRGSLEIY